MRKNSGSQCANWNKTLIIVACIKKETKKIVKERFQSFERLIRCFTKLNIKQELGKGNQEKNSLPINLC